MRDALDRIQEVQDWFTERVDGSLHAREQFEREGRMELVPALTSQILSYRRQSEKLSQAAERIRSALGRVQTFNNPRSFQEPGT